MPLTSTYAVRVGFPGRRRPLCVRAHRAWSTDGTGKTHGRGRWERLRRPSAQICDSELAFSGCLLDVVISLVIGFRLGLGVQSTEGVGNPLVAAQPARRSSARRSWQDCDAVPGAADDLADLAAALRRSTQPQVRPRYISALTCKNPAGQDASPCWSQRVDGAHTGRTTRGCPETPGGRSRADMAASRAGRGR